MEGDTPALQVGQFLSISNISGGYSSLVDMIIRPPRFTYSIADLGPSRFKLRGRLFKRTDVQIKNNRGLKLEVSHYEPIKAQRIRKRLPCVIYCHGNCGSRLDAIDSLGVLLPYNITMVSLDFSGSGLSEGEYVSLGYWEKDDLTCVIEWLRSLGTVSRIGLWGRSMGAATSILYGQQDPSVAGIVLDSAFSSLLTICRELVESTQLKIPRMMVNIGLKIIRKTIMSKAKFDISKLEPIAASETCFVPALFCHGESDTFVKPHHSEELYEKHAGDKNFVLVEGDHNSARPKFFYDSVGIFFQERLLSDNEKAEDAERLEKLLKEGGDNGIPMSPSFEREAIGVAISDNPSVGDIEEEMVRQAILLSLQQDAGASASLVGLEEGKDRSRMKKEEEEEEEKEKEKVVAVTEREKKDKEDEDIEALDQLYRVMNADASGSLEHCTTKEDGSDENGEESGEKGEPEVPKKKGKAKAKSGSKGKKTKVKERRKKDVSRKPGK